MKDKTPMHPLEAKVADYLNGHLSVDEEQTFAEQLATDEHLRALLAFEQRLQSSMRKAQEITAEAPVSAMQLKQFSDRIKSTPSKRSAGSWFNLSSWSWGVPAFAALALAVFVVLELPSTSVNEYELLSDTNHTLAQPVLRVIYLPQTSRADMENLVSDYHLDVVTWHLQANAVDVAFAEVEDVAALQQQLDSDQRVRLVQRLGRTP